MILHSLQLQNYRRFRDQALEFVENLQGFIGANGAGKTTLVEAVGWALYGTRATRGSKTDIRSQAASPQEACEVRLVFEIDGNQFRIERKLRGKNAIAEAAIYRAGDEQAVAEQEQGVNAFVEKLLGLDYRSFFASVFARQKELSALGDMKPEERRKAINRLIDIDAIDRARERARARRNQQAAELSGMQSMLQDPEELKKRVQSAKEIVRQETAAEKMAAGLHQKAAEKFAASKQALEKITALRDQHNAAQAELGKTKATLEAVARQQKLLAEDLKRIDRQRDELARLAPQLEEFQRLVLEKEAAELNRVKFERVLHLRSQIDENQHQVNEDEKLLARLQKEIAEIGDLQAAVAKNAAEFEAIKRELEGATARKTRLETEIGALKIQGQDLRQQLDKIKTLGRDGRCPVCTRKLGTHYGEVTTHLNAELERLRGRYRKLQAELPALVEKIKSMEMQQEACSRAQTLLAQQAAALEHKQAELATTAARLDKFQAQVMARRQEAAEIGDVQFDAAGHKALLQRFEKLNKVNEHAIGLRTQIDRRPEVVNQIKVLEEQTSRLTELVNGLATKLRELEFDEAQYQSARQAYEADLEGERTVRETLTKCRQQLGIAKSRLADAEEALRETLAKRQKLEALQEEIRYLDELILQFGNFRVHLASRLQPMIAARASELLQLTTQGRYSLLELDEDYNIKIMDQGDIFPLQRFSGGEQDLANLCLRVAISQVVAERSGRPPIQFIVLDEVFGSQDSQRQNNILQALHQLQSRFRQIFIISHVEEIKEILPVVIEVEMSGPLESQARLL